MVETFQANFSRNVRDVSTSRLQIPPGDSKPNFMNRSMPKETTGFERTCLIEKTHAAAQIRRVTIEHIVYRNPLGAPKAHRAESSLRHMVRNSPADSCWQNTCAWSISKTCHTRTHTHTLRRTWRKILRTCLKAEHQHPKHVLPMPHGAAKIDYIPCTPSNTTLSFLFRAAPAVT